eukprot:16432533-Heterocapsa_arctica.AAC.1
MAACDGDRTITTPLALEPATRVPASCVQPISFSLSYACYSQWRTEAGQATHYHRCRTALPATRESGHSCITKGLNVISRIMASYKY